jgi:7-cyano-7-deazaguanine tRNA-ribosyltransferase
LEIVAGISLKGIKPRVWDESSEYYLSQLQAIMISYADFHAMSKRRREAMDKGIHESLGIPNKVKIYLDNGAFYFLRREGETSTQDYENFVKEARPDWYPIPQDFIPTPKMDLEEQELCFNKTMNMNLAYQSNSQYIPVVHISSFLEDYINQIQESRELLSKPCIALGGVVPNLLRAPKALSHQKIIDNILQFREAFRNKQLHIFGIGGTATLHIAALLGINSVDSSGWRNRAARGIIQLPGTGERIVAQLGNWRGRELSQKEVEKLKTCQCPACIKYNLEGLKKKGSEGFWNRATHNLWVLLEEDQLIQTYLTLGIEEYQEWYRSHLDNTIYRPLIDQIVKVLLSQKITDNQDLINTEVA